MAAWAANVGPLPDNFQEAVSVLFQALEAATTTGSRVWRKQMLKWIPLVHAITAADKDGVGPAMEKITSCVSKPTFETNADSATLNLSPLILALVPANGAAVASPGSTLPAADDNNNIPDMFDAYVMDQAASGTLSAAVLPRLQALAINKALAATLNDTMLTAFGIPLKADHLILLPLAQAFTRAENS